MRITDDQLTKFQQLYLQTFGVPISRQDALVEAMALLRLVRVLARPSDHTAQQRVDTRPGT